MIATKTTPSATEPANSEVEGSRPDIEDRPQAARGVEEEEEKDKEKGATEPDAIRPAPAVHEHLAAVLIQAHIRGNRDRKHYDFFRHREDTKIQAGGGQCQYCHNCCPAHVNLLCVSWLSGVVELRRYSIASLRQAQRSTGSKADAKR